MFPDSRNLVMFAERFGFTGTGGGGIGVSRVRSARWRRLSVSSSSLSAREFDEAVMDFEEGSMCNGRNVKVSFSSILTFCSRNFRLLFFCACDSRSLVSPALLLVVKIGRNERGVFESCVQRT